MSDLRTFDAITDADVDLVGGKGLSLGRMASAGLPVPPGFCITTAAYRRLSPALDPALSAALADAYRGLGGGPVAVRSSATAEDGAAASFAGQQETILGVEGEAEVCAAVERCWRSLHTDRAKAYRVKQGVDEAGLAMAVVVQRLVPAEVAGVLFTRDPLDPSGRRMLAEASWGLGESVVSGRVTPDRFQIDRDSGAVLGRQLGRKTVEVTRDGERPVPSERQEAFCLDDAKLAELAELGRRVEAFYGSPRDVEWAYAGGRFWLLQARPITTAGADERELVRREEVEALRRLAEPGGTVWSRYHLIEVLPEPTPMTWAVVSGRLLSGGGGTGRMFRDLGFSPDPALESASVYDLIGGRPYCNLSREPRLESARPTTVYPFAALKSEPSRALDPKNERRRPPGLRGLLRLPALLFQSARVLVRMQELVKGFADDFRGRIVPAFTADLGRFDPELDRLETPDLLARFEAWVQRTLVDFARDSLKPTVLAEFCWQFLERLLQKPLGEERTRAALAELSRDAHPDPEAALAQGIRDLAAGRLDRGTFLERFGHRGSNEMELAAPRWAEDPASLERTLAASHGPEPAPPADPKEVQERIIAEAKLSGSSADMLRQHAERLRTYLGLRETAKHHLMRGYALIRRLLLELDRRHELNGGIFFLTPAELPDLIAGREEPGRIAERRKRRAVALSLEVPPVLFSDDLEAIGRPAPPPADGERLQGAALSAGVAEGPALVLTEPAAVPDSLEGYVLVCPSTDPAWVPLFVRAKALVMESGGVLSHGAIVAREFGLPAVAGLPGVQYRLKTGQRLHVDGSRGVVTVVKT